LPKTLRKPLYLLWSQFTKVNLNEVEKDLEEYESLCDFFTRKIKNIDFTNESNLLSPGKFLN
jgi:phosphatidylserine decarboxylase